MKFVAAQMKHETHTFVPVTTPLSRFTFLGGEPPFGPAAAASCRGRNTALSAFVDTVESEGHECVVPVMGEAMPSGPVEDQAFEWFCEKISAAVKEGCDGVLLDLHGSMVTESFQDGEGELLTRIRTIAPRVPIGVALDFHATLTDRIVDNASFITLYRTLPHVDMYDTGARTAKLMLSAIQKKTRPVMAVSRIPLLASLEKMDPKDHPLKEVWDAIHRLEKNQGILNIDLSCGHPFTDVYPGGMGIVVTTDDSPEAGEAAAEEILKLIWGYRHDLVVQVEPYRESLKKALALPEGPVIMADSGDIPASGGFAADMTVLKTAMEMGFKDLIAGPIHDPEAVRRMIQAGVGNELTIDVGGRTEAPLLHYKAEPLSFNGRVRAIVDGRITATGPMLRGLTVSIGLMAVLSTDDMDILITEQRIEALDVAVFTHVGLDPREKKYTLLKSRQHFRAAFEPIARHVVRIAGPGVTNPDFTSFPFRYIDRPVFPLEKDTEFRMNPLGTPRKS
ncbi:MAG TPA: M81 family peptidase [Spirochaetes bacterium]|nr:M81 family peptidase [Spirochaetota bacterium]